MGNGNHTSLAPVVAFLVNLFLFFFRFETLVKMATVTPRKKEATNPLSHVCSLTLLLSFYKSPTSLQPPSLSTFTTCCVSFSLSYFPTPPFLRHLPLSLLLHLPSPPFPLADIPPLPSIFPPLLNPPPLFSCNLRPIQRKSLWKKQVYLVLK